MIMAYWQTNTGNHVPAIRLEAEKRLGILHHTTSADFGWAGDIRKRLVQELESEFLSVLGSCDTNYTNCQIHRLRRERG